MTRHMRDLIGKDVLAAFPGKSERCLVGESKGNGLRLGYEGWGRPDVLLDPTLPLDACVSYLGLSGKFDSVKSMGYLNCVHGDCSLSHALAGLAMLVRPGGTLEIEFLATADLARDAIERIQAWDYAGGQSREKFCFRQPVDASGLVYQQTFLSAPRVMLVLRSHVDAIVTKEVSTVALPETADALRLPGVTDEAWISPRKIDGGGTRPSCVLCKRPATMTDHNRSVFSRYCKDHYHQARLSWDAMLVETFTVRISGTRPDCPACDVEPAPIPVEMIVAGRDYCRSIGMDPVGAAEIDCGCDGLAPGEIWSLLSGLAEDVIIVVGDWRVGESRGIDTFDAVIKYAEDNFFTIKQVKASEGWFVVVMGRRF